MARSEGKWGSKNKLKAESSKLIEEKCRADGTKRKNREKWRNGEAGRRGDGATDNRGSDKELKAESSKKRAKGQGAKGISDNDSLGYRAFSFQAFWKSRRP